MAAPHSLAALVPYVRALLEAGQTVEAVAHAQTLQQANMAVPDAHVLYGDALSAAGRYADAAEAYQKAGNLAFTEGTALRMVAAFGRAGNPASAMNVLRLYITQNPLSDRKSKRLNS